ncbi:MAG: glycosyltransferase family 2 protein [Pyrinomonadaceae bacterium]
MKVSAPENQKTFSIIIATYNCGQKIENTLRSIFSNDEELFELIVMDGASTDDTLEYIKKYEDRLNVISESDEGVYYAFNKAIDLATGKYLYFIGAGDCLKPDILRQVKEFLPLEVPAFVYGKCYFVKQKNLNGKKFTDALFIRDNLCQQGIFYHREIFDIIGKFDLRYKVLADWFFNLKCFMSGEITKNYVDLVIADYEEGGLSSEITCDPVFVEEFPLFVRKHFGIIKYVTCKAFLKSPYLFNYIYYRQYRLLIMHIINHLRNSELG